MYLFLTVLGLYCCAGFSLAVESLGYSLVVVHGWVHKLSIAVASHCRACALGHTGSSNCGSLAREHRLNSCGTETSLLHGMWPLPRPGIETISCVGRRILYH